jgi:hypothetical protein
MRAFTDIDFRDTPREKDMWSHPDYGHPWFVEVLIDSGQRLVSGDLSRGQAITMAEEMRVALRTTVVSMINWATGEAHVRAGVMLWAAKGRSTEGYILGWEDQERDLIAEACR